MRRLVSLCQIYQLRSCSTPQKLLILKVINSIQIKLTIMVITSVSIKVHIRPKFNCFDR